MGLQMSEQCVCSMRNLKFSKMKNRAEGQWSGRRVLTQADTFGSVSELEAWERENLVSKGSFSAPDEA